MHLVNPTMVRFCSGGLCIESRELFISSFILKEFSWYYFPVGPLNEAFNLNLWCCGSHPFLFPFTSMSPWWELSWIAQPRVPHSCPDLGTCAPPFISFSLLSFPKPYSYLVKFTFPTRRRRRELTLFLAGKRKERKGNTPVILQY